MVSCFLERCLGSKVHALNGTLIQEQGKSYSMSILEYSTAHPRPLFCSNLWNFLERVLPNKFDIG